MAWQKKSTFDSIDFREVLCFTSVSISLKPLTEQSFYSVNAKTKLKLWINCKEEILDFREVCCNRNGLSTSCVSSWLITTSYYNTFGFGEDRLCSEQYDVLTLQASYVNDNVIYFLIYTKPVKITRKLLFPQQIYFFNVTIFFQIWKHVNIPIKMIL